MLTQIQFSEKLSIAVVLKRGKYGYRKMSQEDSEYLGETIVAWTRLEVVGTLRMGWL